MFVSYGDSVGPPTPGVRPPHATQRVPPFQYPIQGGGGYGSPEVDSRFSSYGDEQQQLHNATNNDSPYREEETLLGAGSHTTIVGSGVVPRNGIFPRNDRNDTLQIQDHYPYASSPDQRYGHLT